MAEARIQENSPAVSGASSDEEVEDGRSNRDYENDAGDASDESPREDRVDDEDDDDDEDIAPSRRKDRTETTEGAPNGANGFVVEDDDEALDDDEDLFGGSGSDEEGDSSKRKPRLLDDEDLDSGDDEGREDRVGDEMEGVEVPEEKHTVLDVTLGRHAQPQPSDGELYILRMPNFLGIDPKAFHHKTFQPPTTDHRSDAPPSSGFSAYSTAMSTLRWRHSPSNPTELQSNARILRWSDGSLTLQFASNPTEQYQLPAKSLAPPQIRPRKPTPTSVSTTKANATKGYDPNLDSHTYLFAPHESAAVLRATNHITTSLTVHPTSNVNDEALERLQDSLAKAVRGKHTGGTDGGIGVISITEDPELAKKKAEVAEREKLRAQRRRENQEARDRDRAKRTLGRTGLRHGGLTVGGLEDDDGGALGNVRRTMRAPGKARRGPRRGDLTDDEDDDGYMRRGGGNREDEYDEDDGFLVGSDEEEEVPEESSEEEEFEDERTAGRGGHGGHGGHGGQRERERATSGSPPGAGGASKRRADSRGAAGQGDGHDGGEGGDADDEEAAAVVARAKRRRVVDEDEDDE
ncbi:MAG: hypothetical protein M1819_000019 [Sarea resinae]|nr:MAG: hypothetical protein M1819_000019 [Sarea resinae]